MELKETVTIRAVSNGYVIKHRDVELIESTKKGCCTFLANSLDSIIPAEMNNKITIEFSLKK